MMGPSPYQLFSTKQGARNKKQDTQEVAVVIDLCAGLGGNMVGHAWAGWRLINVPFYEWDALGSREAQHGFLQRRLGEVGL